MTVNGNRKPYEVAHGDVSRTLLFSFETNVQDFLMCGTDAAKVACADSLKKALNSSIATALVASILKLIFCFKLQEW